MLSEVRRRELQLQGMTPEEIETMIVESRARTVAREGYDSSLVARLESNIYKDDKIPDELRAEYEEALLQKERILENEQTERLELLGSPGPECDTSPYMGLDLEPFAIEVTLDHGQKTARELVQLKKIQKARLKFRAFGGVAAQLALLAGEEVAFNTEFVPEMLPDLRLPNYFDAQVRKIQAIAAEREAITI